MGISALGVDDLDLTHVVDAVNDLQIAVGLPARPVAVPGPRPPISARYTDVVGRPGPRTEGALWYRREDAEGPIARLGPPPRRPAPPGLRRPRSVAGTKEMAE